MIQNVKPDFRRFINDGVTIEQLITFVYREWGYRTNPFLDDTAESQQYQTYCDEQENRRNQKWENIPDVQVERLPSKRRLEQPKLKILFSTIHDIALRLRGSVIFIGSKLYYVMEVINLRREPFLIVSDDTERQYKIPYSSPDIDLRSVEPQYVNMQYTTNYLFRPPLRVQKQGMSHENMMIKPPGGRAARLRDIRPLMSVISRDVLSWSAPYLALLQTRAVPNLRLSKNISAYLQDDLLCAEYKGRYLGRIQEDTITMDEHDFEKPWIIEAVRQINCEARQA